MSITAAIPPKAEQYSPDSEEDLKKSSSSSFSSVPSTGCADELYGIPKRENFVSTTSSATCCSSTQYTRDIFLVYDPNHDYYNANALLKEIEPLGLSILDYNRDAPPGVPSTRFFAKALKDCKYTCIVVSRSFMENFWITFKADMAIENMLEDESTQYTGRLVIVAMDSTLKCSDLPLDLRTISPICYSERFFKNRIMKAFQANQFQWMSGYFNQQRSSSHSTSDRLSTTSHQSYDRRSSPTACTEESCEPSSDVHPSSFRLSVDYSSSKVSPQERSSFPSPSKTSHEDKPTTHNSSSSESHGLSSQLQERLRDTLHPSSEACSQAIDLQMNQTQNSSSPYEERPCLSLPTPQRPNDGFVTSQRSYDSVPSSQEGSSFSVSGGNSRSSSPASDIYSGADSGLKKKNAGRATKDMVDRTRSSAASAVPLSFSNFGDSDSDTDKLTKVSKDNENYSTLTTKTDGVHDTSLSSRVPMEHTEDGPHIDGVQRMISVTRNSTGLRQPTEGDDSLESNFSINQSWTSTMQPQPASFPVMSCDLNERKTCGKITLSLSNNNSSISPHSSEGKQSTPAFASSNPLDNPVHSGPIQLVPNEISVDDSLEHFDVEISDEELPRPVQVKTEPPAQSSPRRSTKGSSVSLNLRDSFDSIGSSVKEGFSSLKSLFK